MTTEVFVDSNLWLYQLLDFQSAEKAEKVRSAIARIDRVVISHQVLVEIGANLVKKSKLPEVVIRGHLADVIACSDLIAVDGRVIFRASTIRETGSWSYWDSLIIAAALESGCAELWSEDLQHGQVINGRLRIVNPLIPST